MKHTAQSLSLDQTIKDLAHINRLYRQIKATVNLMKKAKKHKDGSLMTAERYEEHRATAKATVALMLDELMLNAFAVGQGDDLDREARAQDITNILIK